MDPALLQPSLHQAKAEDVKPAATTAGTTPQTTKPPVTNGSSATEGRTAADSSAPTAQEDDADASDTGGDGVKRPRLRLAHACDRCRKRKIRCDTQQPCGPCSATKNECTFNTPSRRVAKPKGEARSSSTSGVKRPHSPTRSGGNSQYQASLEARLATLEASLRDVPPNVHNAYLSTLDARLGAGQGVGMAQGKGDGVGLSAEASAASGPMLGGSAFSSAFAGLKGDTTSAPAWSAPTSLTGAWAGGRSSRRREGNIEDVTRRMETLSFFYEDEIGQAKWQGATSGFPSLEILTAAKTQSEEEMSPDTSSPSSTEAAGNQPAAAPSPQDRVGRRGTPHSVAGGGGRSASVGASKRSSSTPPMKDRFFPDRTPRPHQTLNPEASWKVITGVIPPDLMDTLVRCYLSTSHLSWPFLHVPSFSADYANPQQWGEPGFACFIVAVCTLSSRHVDDPRVRANPSDPSTAGKQYFESFKRLRDLPSADRPTLYSIQAAFLAAIYAFGLGNSSKAFALQAESVTLCLDGGLHRSVDSYDHFNPIECETRKRTFWSIYSWDKQSAALFGRPPIIHSRDCDVTEPMIIDDENSSADGAKEQKNPEQSRMCAFVAAIRLHVVSEGVIDSCVHPSSFPSSPFSAQASATICRRTPQNESLGDEEKLSEEWSRISPKYWAYDAETAASRDPIRITQAERSHCLEHLVKMIIYRHRFSGFVTQPASTVEEIARHVECCRRAMQCASTIIADHVHISQRGMMTYYGVHVIHQLAQAGRTLVAVISNCKNPEFKALIAPSVEGSRSCVGLLRRFSGRYSCGSRSADIIDEFCRVCNIPVDSPRVPDSAGRPSPAWLRPVRRRASVSPAPSGSRNRSPSDFGQDIMSAQPDLTAAQMPGDLESVFNTSEYFDSGPMDISTSPVKNGTALPSTNGNNNASTTTANATSNLNGINGSNGVNGVNGSTGNTSGFGAGPTSGEPTAAFDRSETLSPNENLGSLGNATLQQYINSHANSNGSTAMEGVQFTNGDGTDGAPSTAMDSVGDGSQGAASGGSSAATILSLLEEGTFDYGSIFTDQAPLPDFDFTTGMISENGTST